MPRKNGVANHFRSAHNDAMNLFRAQLTGWQARLVILALGPLATAAASGATMESRLAGRFHLAANVGPSFVESTHLTGYDDYESGRIRFDPGARLDASINFDVIDHLSIGFESGFIFNFTTLQGVGSWRSDAGLYQTPFLGTITYQIPTGTRLRPFIGVAFGGVETTLVDYDFLDASDDDLGLAWQGTAGCRYELSEAIALGLAYQYLGTTDRKFDQLEAKIDGTRTHSVTLSLSIRF